MNMQDTDTLEKIRQQYEQSPYPRYPLDAHPREQDPNLNELFIENLTTPYYLRNQRLPNLTDRIILDAGCGSGYRTLGLAYANPGAKIVGVDLSPESAGLAEQRLRYHGYDNVECYSLLLEELPSLGLQFDYINCDEVLYLLPDPVAGLQAMMSVLKPDGIIRTNLHSSFQRHMFYRAQKLFRMMGLMDGNPGDMEVEIVRETMEALKPHVDLRKNAWNESLADSQNPYGILMNYLIRGDRGFTIPNMFDLLQSANSEFIAMTFWRHWEIIDLFKDPDEMPPICAMALPDLSHEDRLHMYELMNPVYRLLDFWCGHIGQAQPFKPVGQWEHQDWHRATVYLNPLIQTLAIRNDALNHFRAHKPFEISQYIPLPTTKPVILKSYDVAFLLPLWDKPQPFDALVKRYLQLHPIDPISLAPRDEKAAVQYVSRLVGNLESFLYLMVEQPQ